MHTKQTQREHDMTAMLPRSVMTTTDDREAWLIECGEMIMNDFLDTAAEEHGLPRPPVKYSVSFAPNTRIGSKRLGTCSARSVSKSGHNEIFISPELDGSQSVRILDVLVHELIHAYDDIQNGHKGRFKAIALAVGLEGKMTATTANEALTEILTGYVDLLGPIPHAELNYSQMIKKQTSRHIKVECTECDFKFRTSRKLIDQFTHNTCLVCNNPSLFEPEQ